MSETRPGTIIRKIASILGPGVITGAADDDPSGIATYSQTGAQFGYGQLWTSFFILPFQIAVQDTCARIGAVNGKGLVSVIKRYYPKWVVYLTCILILTANTINIGANIGAMASALQLLIPVPFVVLALMFTMVVLVLEIFTSYKTYARILKWLCLSLITYPLTVILVQQPWQDILKATIFPHIEWSFAYMFIITGIVGTTISPYMFFWQASEEVEEEQELHLKHAHGKPVLPRRFIRNIRIDTVAGMLLSQLAAWSIIVVTGTVLHNNGITDVQTSADAARALEPLVRSFPNAGFLSKFLFCTGIIGLGLLSVPVLSGSASYAISEAFNWKEGLNLSIRRAHGFYGVMTIATIIGLCINFVGIDPIKALVFAAVANGIVAVPLLFLVATIGGNARIMGTHRNGPVAGALVWSTCIGMGLCVALLFFFLGK